MSAYKSQKKIGVFLSYAAEAVQILTGLLYVPIILRILGQQEYGLYQLTTAVISNLSLLSLGFNSAYVTFYSRFKIKKDNTKIAGLNGMFLIIFAIIAALCLLCGSIIVFNAGFVLGDKITGNELQKAQVLMAILVITMAVSFIGKVFQAQISAQNKFIWLKAVDLTANIINPFLSLPLLLLGYGSIGLVLVSFFVNLISAILNFMYVIKKLEVKFIFNEFDFTLFKEMSHFVIYIFMNIVIEQINWSLDKFLLGRIRGTESVAVYGVGSQIISIYRTVGGTIRTVYIPTINDMVARKCSKDELTNLFSKLGRIIYLITFLVLSGFIVFGKQFISLWVGGEYAISYYVALFPMIVLLMTCMQGPGIDIQRAMNLHKARSIAYLCVALGNIVISIYLIQIMGEVGASIGTALALLLGNGIFMNWYYNYKIGLNMVMFWKQISGFLPSSIIVLLAGSAINKIYGIDSWIKLGGGIFIYILVYVMAFVLIGMNHDEKQLVLKPLKKFTKRKE